MIKYSIFAGKFNPPHYGHCFAIDKALVVNPENIILICPYIDNSMSEEQYNNVLTMSKLFFVNLYLEDSYKIINYRYSQFADLLEYLTITLKQASFNIIIDNNTKLSEWKKYNRIIDENTFTIIERKLNISSSMIRSLCENKEYDGATKHTSEEVIEYVKTNNLYQRS